MLGQSWGMFDVLGDGQIVSLSLEQAGQNFDGLWDVQMVFLLLGQSWVMMNADVWMVLVIARTVMEKEVMEKDGSRDV